MMKNGFIIWSIRCQKMVSTSHHNFPQPRVMYSICLFCPTNHPNVKEITFVDIDDIAISKLEKKKHSSKIKIVAPVRTIS